MSVDDVVPAGDDMDVDDEKQTADEFREPDPGDDDECVESENSSGNSSGDEKRGEYFAFLCSMFCAFCLCFEASCFPTLPCQKHKQTYVLHMKPHHDRGALCPTKKNDSDEENLVFSTFGSFRFNMYTFLSRKFSCNKPLVVGRSKSQF